jgi:DNA-3-methyladenine glycosylase I
VDEGATAAGSDGRLAVGADGVQRCSWAVSAADYVSYHDAEWGIPISDDVRLFEKLSLEGFQAGLSWLTILRKRDAFRHAFAGFDFERVARFSERDVDRLVADPGIVRHRGKIESVINNAQHALELVEEEGSLAHYIWRFEPRPWHGELDRAGLEQLATAPEAKVLAKDLKARGWKFVGATTVYAFMQAVGLVNDHVPGCQSRTSTESARSRFARP